MGRQPKQTQSTRSKSISTGPANRLRHRKPNKPNKPNPEILRKGKTLKQMNSYLKSTLTDILRLNHEYQTVNRVKYYNKMIQQDADGFLQNAQDPQPVVNSSSTGAEFDNESPAKNRIYCENVLALASTTLQALKILQVHKKRQAKNKN